MTGLEEGKTAVSKWCSPSNRHFAMSPKGEISMSDFLTMTIRRLVVMLIAAGFTIGIPALFPGNRDKKPYYSRWALSVAGVFLFFTFAEFVSIFVNGLVKWAFVFVLAVSMDILGQKLKIITWDFTGEMKKDQIGVVSGLCSGIMIALGVGLNVSEDIVPACIFLIFYCTLNVVFVLFCN